MWDLHRRSTLPRERALREIDLDFIERKENYKRARCMSHDTPFSEARRLYNLPGPIQDLIMEYVKYDMDF